jgi:serine/threonine protein kinase
VSSHAVEGTRLVDRYRLDKQLGEAAGTTYWRAHDELLDRAVGICLLPAGDDHAERVLHAARRAAALTDARFLRVLDASEVDGPLGKVVYVVNEWVRATNLTDLLADGPLSPGEARDIALAVAEALCAAHEAGLAHLCLEPEHVLRTTHGQVKLVGLAVEAAVRGIEVPGEPAAARRDTEGAAAIMYAALTARWPGSEATGLAPAPLDGTGATCSPRQVRAGVPHELDAVVCRSLDIGHPESPLSTPETLAATLSDGHLTSRIPVVRATSENRPAAGAGGAAPLAPFDDQGPRRTSRTTLLAWAAVVFVLAVGVALAGSQIYLAGFGGSGSAKGGSGKNTSAPTGSNAPPTGTKINVKGVTSFDPEGDGEENNADAPLVADGKRSTVWITNYYNDPFGPTGLKDGVGLVLDLGSVHTISAVRVVTVGGGTDVRVGFADQPGSQLADFTMIKRTARDVDGPATVVPRSDDPQHGRYVLVWLTKLPLDGNVYRGRIAEVTVYG